MKKRTKVWISLGCALGILGILTVLQVFDYGLFHITAPSTRHTQCAEYPNNSPHMTQIGTELYFSVYSREKSGIFKTGSSTGLPGRLSTADTGRLGACGDSIYYLADYSPVTSTNTRLYRKKNNGFMRKKLVDAKVSFFTIHDHALYFLSPDAAYRSGIYRMELDGSNLRLVAETTASSFKIVGDTLYFLEGGYDGNAQPQDILYTCPLTGGGKTVRCTLPKIVDFKLENGILYLDTGNAILQAGANAEDSPVQLVRTGKIVSWNLADGRIFFMIDDSSGRSAASYILYEMHADGSGLRRLSGFDSYCELYYFGGPEVFLYFGSGITDTSIQALDLQSRTYREVYP